MMSADDLAKEMFATFEAKDADGNDVPPPDGMKAFAKGFIDMLTKGKMLGTVTGFGTPSGGPFKGESAKGNLVALVPALLASKVQAAIPTGQPPLIVQEAAAVAAYFMAQPNITFANVTGICTAVPGTPPVPGPLTLGQANGGKLMGATGSALAAQVAAMTGATVTPGMIKLYDALCNYVMKNIELSYPMNQINGLCSIPPVPCPLVGGVGSGGVIR